MKREHQMIVMPSPNLICSPISHPHILHCAAGLSKVNPQEIPHFPTHSPKPATVGNGVVFLQNSYPW